MINTSPTNTVTTEAASAASMVSCRARCAAWLGFDGTARVERLVR